MKKILILGAPFSQIPIIQKAQQMGCYVGIVDINPAAFAIPYADEYFQCSIKNKQGVLDIASQFKPDGIVIGACDVSVVAAAYVCNMLGLPGHTEETALKATNKYEMLKAFEEHNVPHPKYQLIKKAELKKTPLLIPYPMISKPTDSSGSRGINCIEHEGQFMKALEYSSSAGESGDVLLEEYMDGPEVSVEVLVVNGEPYVIQITDKVTSGLPNFYEIGHSQPSILPDSVKQEIKQAAKKAVKAIGLINSAAHVEIKVTSEGPKLVEMGARMGGDCITTHLLNTSISGINMAECIIKMALGVTPEVTRYEDSGVHVAISFIPAKKGYITSIEGLDEAEKIGNDNIVSLNIWAQVGDCYENAADNSARFGYVVAKANTHDAALEICQRVIQTIKFTLE